MRGAVALAIGSACVACSLLVQTNAEQCGSDDDCARLFPGEICSGDHVCVHPATGDAGDTGVDADDAGDADGGCWDPAGFGGRGCYRCTPTTSEELLNACTTSAFVGFDDETRIGGFDPKNPRPALPSLDAGADTSDGASDTALDASDASDVSDASDASDADDAGDAGPDTAPPPPPPCPSLESMSNVVVVVGSTGLLFQPTLDALETGVVVAKIVGSCDGVNAMQPGGPKASGLVTIYRPRADALECTLDRSYEADLGAGGLFWDSCNPAVPQPSDVRDMLGAVNPVGFIVPRGSTQEAISAAAAYKVYGFGADSKVLPWIDESVLFRRNPTSANQNLIAIATELPVDRFLGTDSKGGGNMINLVHGVPIEKTEATLGISSSDQTDKSRLTVKVIAYQHVDQRAAFYWDSEPGASDRRPVRDGHYFLWVPIHVFARLLEGDIVGNNPSLDAHRSPTFVSDLASYLTVRRPLPGSADIIGALKAPDGGSAAIPQCAMRVTRRKDGGPLEPFTPSGSCACAFEAAPPGATPPECKRCSKPSECPAERPVCSFGYCETN